MNIFGLEIRKRQTSKSSSDVYDDFWYTVGGFDTASGVTISERGALNIACVHACVRVLAEAVSALPLFLYEREKKGKRKAVNSPLFSRLHLQPNSEMSSMIYREVMMVHLALWGNHYSEIVRDMADRVIALWPLLPDRMDVKRMPDKQLEYSYNVPNGGTIVFPREKILHIPGMGFDGLMGKSPISLGRESLGLTKAAQNFGSRFFANDTTMGVIFKFPNKLSDAAREHVKKSLEQFKKPENKHKNVVLEEGGEFARLNLPPTDAQFLETRKFQRSEIAGWFKVPLHMINDLEKATFSNIEHQSLEFVTHSLMPWLVRIEQAFTIQLQVGEDITKYFAEHLVAGLLRGDIKSRYEAYAVGRQNGWLSANDIREMENMNPIEHGDVYLIPLNMIPIDQAVSPVLALPPPGKNAVRALTFRSITERERIAQSHKRLFLQGGRQLISKETLAVQRAAKKYLKDKDFDGFFMWMNNFYEGYPEYIRKVMGPVIMTFGEAIAEVARAEAGSDMDMDAEVASFIDGYTKAFSTRHVSSSQGQITQLVTGQDMEPEGAFDRVTLRADEWAETRPEKIAAREIVQGNNGMTRAVWMTAGVLSIVWIARGSKPCPYCQALDGVTIGIQQSFVAKGEQFEPDGADGSMNIRGPKMHPPLHTGCECGIGIG